jgi:hypothetical protein
MLQDTFRSFTPFLQVGMKFLGFGTSWLQKDIASFLEYGPQDLMVQAQRGQAKSTITALFAVWTLIHNPKARVLIVSAGGTQANEVSTLITRIILNMDILTCLRPDASHGDRTSVEAFDVHHALKGVDKSPSVACIGITGNLPGKRADLLIADDIESPKNSNTAGMRELIRERVKEFSSIVSNGRIVYLGTPQTSESIYNDLPAQGFTVRIWPGRYPTEAEREHYGTMLAPSILAAIDRDGSLVKGGGLDGTRGQPTDPELLNEAALQGKEKKQGAATFQLQFMLSTKLNDELRYPLKTKNMVVMRLNDLLPCQVIRGMTPDFLRPYKVGSNNFVVSVPQEVSRECSRPTVRRMRVDPAGGGVNGDESAFAVVDLLGGNIFVRRIGAVPGGYEQVTMDKLVAEVVRWNPDVLDIEKNFGYGAFTQIVLPLLRKAGWMGKTQDVFETGQKEQRICDVLEPILGRGSLIFDESVLEDDWASTGHLPDAKRQLFTFIHQFTKITRNKGALVKDDRLDALAGAVAPFVAALAQDQDRNVQSARDKEYQKWLDDPRSRNRYNSPTGVRANFPTTIRRR